MVIFIIFAKIKNAKIGKMMKKIKMLSAITLIAIVMSSCGVILGGKIQSCQRDKPTSNEEKRKIRPWALVGDIILVETIIPIIVDFATGGIYKPCDKQQKQENTENKK